MRPSGKDRTSKKPYIRLKLNEEKWKWLSGQNVEDAENHIAVMTGIMNKRQFKLVWEVGIAFCAWEISLFFLIKFNWLRCVQTCNKDSNQDKLPEDASKMPNYYLLPNLQPNGKLAKEDRK